jgi:hypothetical protein
MISSNWFGSIRVKSLPMYSRDLKSTLNDFEKSGSSSAFRVIVTLNLFNDSKFSTKETSWLSSIKKFGFFKKCKIKIKTYRASSFSAPAFK